MRERDFLDHIRLQGFGHMVKKMVILFANCLMLCVWHGCLLYHLSLQFLSSVINLFTL